MKYVVIIPDGAADEPLDELEGRTCLEASATPALDYLGRIGRTGTVHNVPPELPAGSDVAIMSLLGYDPRECYTGRAPLEAAAKKIRSAADEMIFRCNLVTVVDGIMEDFSAGHIRQKEASSLIAALNDAMSGQGVVFHEGISYRHLMVCKGADRFDKMTTTAPHDIMGQSVVDHVPKGGGAKDIMELMARAADIMDGHEVNQIRRDLGENPANAIWLWGHGRNPRMTLFRKKYNKRGAVITEVDLVRGIGELIGWRRIEVEGLTGYIDTNFAGMGQAAVEALDDDDIDILCVHIEAPDEAGHNADASAKIQAIESIDEHIVAPVTNKLEQFDAWRILVLPDHPTPVRTRTHNHEPVPFVMAGTGVAALPKDDLRLTEECGRQGDLHINPGCELMEYFLKP